MPDHLYQNQMSPQEYVRLVIENKICDEVLTPQLRAGLSPIELIPNYLPDEESGNCALLLEWPNPIKDTYV